MQRLEQIFKEAYSSKKQAIFTEFRKQGVKPSKISSFTKKGNSCLSQFPTNTSWDSLSSKQAENFRIGKKPSIQTSGPLNQNFQYPYSSIGLLTCNQKGHKVIGTGFLVGPNIVLTSAQNIWSFKEKKLGEHITFCPVYHNMREDIIYHVKKVNVPEELHSAQASQQELLLLNFAIIELDCENIEPDYGTLALNFEQKTIKNESLKIMGYNCCGKDMICEAQGQATSEDGVIRYELNAGYGMCGAPILQNNNGEMEVVGIHVYSRQREGKIERGGIRLTEKVFKYFEKWCTIEQEELDLHEKGIGKQGIKRLSNEKWNNLVSLNLSRNCLESSSAKYLQNGDWQRIVHFDLGGNLIKKEGAQALVMSNLSAITTLNLWGNAIGKRGAYYLSLASWQALTNLNLYNNDIGNEGVEWLTKATWKNLNSLNLGKNNINAEGAGRIMEGDWPDLASLNLWGNKLTGQELTLKSRLMDYFKYLKFLYL